MAKSSPHTVPTDSQWVPFSPMTAVSVVAVLLLTLCSTLAPTAAAFHFPGNIFSGKTAQPQKIDLSGGLLHASGFYFNASVGGQWFTLQVDTSYSSLVVPTKGCLGCRVGDRRYDPGASKSAKRIACGATECASAAHDGRCSSKLCHNCQSDGRCCVEGKSDCAFNIVYGDASSGNGTLFRDEFSVGDIRANVLFGAMHEESHGFELPYADGVFGLAFQKGACRPTCFPPLMDVLVNQTGLANIFTMCVTRYGGTLVLGAADASLAHAPYAFVDVVDDERENRFITSALSGWKVDDHDLNLPDITKAMWTVGVSGIGISKTSFLALLEHFMKFYCHVKGLCSTTSWFRPQHCAPITDEMMSQMPNITIPLTKRVNIVLTPEEYLLPMRVIRGELHRCVAFVMTDAMSARGIGLLLGSAVMRRYAIAHDRKGKRVGIALAKGGGVCGPETGSDEGLPAVMGTGGTVLTADAPAATNAPKWQNTPTQELLAEEEECRAESKCDGCAKRANCSYSYLNGRCVPKVDAGGQPYPFCSGVFCACVAVGPSGWYVGIVIGVLLAAAVAFGIVLVCRKRQRRNVYQPVEGYEEQDLETF